MFRSTIQVTFIFLLPRWYDTIIVESKEDRNMRKRGSYRICGRLMLVERGERPRPQWKLVSLAMKRFRVHSYVFKYMYVRFGCVSWVYHKRKLHKLSGRAIFYSSPNVTSCGAMREIDREYNKKFCHSVIINLGISQPILKVMSRSNFKDLFSKINYTQDYFLYIFLDGSFCR